MKQQTRRKTTRRKRMSTTKSFYAAGYVEATTITSKGSGMTVKLAFTARAALAKSSVSGNTVFHI
jgi:hypothetical protein